MAGLLAYPAFINLPILKIQNSGCGIKALTPQFGVGFTVAGTAFDLNENSLLIHPDTLGLGTNDTKVVTVNLFTNKNKISW